MVENLACRRFRNRIDAYIDNELSASEKEEMLVHAKTCPECAKLLKDTQDVLSLIHSMDDEVEMPAEASQAWRSAIYAEAEKQKKAKKPRAIIRTLETIAAALVLLAGLTTYYRNGYLKPQASVDMIPAFTYSAEVALEATDPAMPENTIVYVAETTKASKAAVVQSDGEVQEAAQEASAVEMAAEDALDAAAEAAEVPESQQIPVLVHSSSRAMQTLDYENDSAAISTLVEKYNGWTESRVESGTPLAENGSGRTLNLKVRVPSDKLDEFLTDLGTVGTTEKTTDTAVDISTQYYDAQGRLTTLYAKLERLNELIADAKDLTDLVDLETKIDEVQYEIEMLESSVRSWDSAVAYATVDISLSEVRTNGEGTIVDSSLGERITEGFRTASSWLREFLKDMLVAVATFWPLIAATAFVIILIMIVVPKVKKNKY